MLVMDNAILDFIQRYMRCGFLDFWMPKISFLGNGGWIWILLAFCLLCTKKYRKVGIALSIGLIMSLLIGNLIFKPLVARERPCWIDTQVSMLIEIPRDYSFPSGHTLASSICAVILLFYRKKWGIIAIVFTVLIAFSRMYLYVHYPSDCLGGIILGVIIGICCIKFTNRIIKTKVND